MHTVAYNSAVKKDQPYGEPRACGRLDIQNLLRAGAERAVGAHPRVVTVRAQIARALVIGSAGSMATAGVGAVRRGCGGQYTKKHHLHRESHIFQKLLSDLLLLFGEGLAKWFEQQH